MATISRENIGNLHDRLVLKVERQDYLPEFEKDIKSFSKKANIPGFRKGMVPAGMVKKMYGQDFFTEAVMKSVDKEMRSYLEKENIDFIGKPLPESEDAFPKFDFNKPEDYQFSFEIGLHPEIKFDSLSSRKITRYKIQPKPEEVDTQIERIQTDYGKLIPVDSVTSPDNIIKFTFTQLNEEGQQTENSPSKEKSFFVKVFTDSFQQKLQGAKKDDEFKGLLKEIVDPATAPQIYENLELNKNDENITNASVVIKIEEVSLTEKHPLDEDLYKAAIPNAEIKTEEEFRSALAADLQKQLDQVAEQNLSHSLQHALMDVPVDIPSDFLKKLFKEDNRNNAEVDLEKDFPRFERNIKTSLISSQIIKDQHLTVTAEEIREEIKKELSQYFGNVDLDAPDYAWVKGYIDRMMTDKEQIERRYDTQMTHKIINWLKTQVQIQEEPISQDDYLEIVKKHNHEHEH